MLPVDFFTPALHDVKTRDRNFEEGEEVYAQNFGSGEKWIPAKVVKVLGPRSCKVRQTCVA